jgi:hypothetical protein
MDRRRTTRVTTALPVRVWGLDANSRPFIQLATVRNMSDKGILLSGLTCVLRKGTVVEIQYDGARAEFLVIWVPPAGVPGEIGLQMLPMQPCIWDAFLERVNGMVANG